MNSKHSIDYSELINLAISEKQKWVQNLTREELHHIVHDRNLPPDLMPELIRFIPPKMLKSLILHKKLPKDLRKVILRRVFKTPIKIMNVKEKIEFLTLLQKQVSWEKGDLQAISSYLALIRTEEKNQAPSTLQKRKKVKQISNQQTSKATVKYIPFPTKVDSSLVVIGKFLYEEMIQFFSQVESEKNPSFKSELKAHLIYSKLKSNIPPLVNLNKHRFTHLDLLKFHFELKQLALDGPYLESSESFLRRFQQEFRGEISDTLIALVDTSNHLPEVLYNMILRVCSKSHQDYLFLKQSISDSCLRVYDYLLEISPILNYGSVNVTSGGMATISFSSSINMEFTFDALRIWEKANPEKTVRTLKIQTQFDPKSILLRCSSTITKLDAGQIYSYDFSGSCYGKTYSLSSRDFKVPEIVPIREYKVPQYDSAGAVVPLGGGGERRFNQLRP